MPNKFHITSFYDGSHCNINLVVNAFKRFDAQTYFLHFLTFHSTNRVDIYGAFLRPLLRRTASHRAMTIAGAGGSCAAVAAGVAALWLPQQQRRQLECAEASRHNPKCEVLSSPAITMLFVALGLWRSAPKPWSTVMHIVQQ